MYLPCPILRGEIGNTILIYFGLIKGDECNIPFLSIVPSVLSLLTFSYVCVILVVLINLLHVHAL